MADSNAGVSALLGMRVPMWALMLAMAGSGATSIAGGSWRWLENNEPRFIEQSARMTSLERDIGEFKTSYQREHQALRTDLEKAATALQIQMATKVNESSRLEMLANLNTRLDQLNRHMETIDSRLEALMDRIASVTTSLNAPPRDRR